MCRPVNRQAIKTTTLKKKPHGAFRVRVRG
jgi:hypothetical protein